MYPKIPHMMAVKGCNGLVAERRARAVGAKIKDKGISNYVLLLAISLKISADTKVVL
jgi:hypothetical protein